MSTTAPPIKKIKLVYKPNTVLQNMDNYIESILVSRKPLKIVLANDILNPVPLTNVYVGHIKETNLISRTILILNEKIPLQELQHLKRVKGRNIVLCPVGSFNSTLSIQTYLEYNVPELNDVFDYFKEVDVPSIPPKVTMQYKEANKIWSVNFHPDKYLESIVNNTLFDVEELRNHRQLMAMTFDVAKWYIQRYNLEIDINLTDINVAVIFDPITSSVVAIATDNRLKHPMQHAAMLGIDNVAKTQDAGAWLSEEEKYKKNRRFSGIDNDLYTYLSDKFPHIKFGARTFVAKSDMNNKDISNGPYLCTGYYIYLMREPCVMCTMGLIHARINRTFFCLDNEAQGALKSRTMLHLNPSLNHRFEAFTGFL